MDYVKYQTERANKTYKTSEINSLDDIMEGVDTAIYPLIYSRIVKIYPEYVV